MIDYIIHEWGKVRPIVQLHKGELVKSKKKRQPSIVEAIESSNLEEKTFQTRRKESAQLVVYPSTWAVTTDEKLFH